MKTCPAEPALFVKFYPNGDFLLVSTSTDDFLCVFTKNMSLRISKPLWTA